MENVMDKSWMNLRWTDPTYLQRVMDFIKFSCKNVHNEETEIVCPCKKCRNVKLVNIDSVKEHLVVEGFYPGYTRWFLHGKNLQSTECGML